MSEYPCAGPISVSITTQTGLCSVTAEERDSASVTVSPYKNDSKSTEAAEATKVEFLDGRLTIRTPEAMTGWLFGRGGAVNIDVKVPLASNVSTKSASASISYRGELSVVSATTASGSVSIEKAAEVSVNTASGEMRVIECTGTANGKTVSGDLQIDHVAGELKAKSVSGDIRVNAAGSSVQGSSVSGDISIGNARSGNCKINSVSGSVSVGVPSGTGVWMDLNTNSGTTSSDLAVGDIPGDTQAALDLRVTAVSGNIDVYRAQT